MLGIGDVILLVLVPWFHCGLRYRVNITSHSFVLSGITIALTLEALCGVDALILKPHEIWQGKYNTISLLATVNRC